MVDSSHSITCSTRDFHKDLVLMPAPLIGLAHRVRALLADSPRKHSTEPTDPEPDALVAHVDAAFMEQAFDVAK